MKALLFIIFSLIVGVTSAMTDSIDSLKPLSTENPPVIDGDLNDEVWTNAPFVTDFKTFRPDFGLEMEHKTVVYMAYDEENIYFAFKCYDVPNLIKTSVAARDQIEADDWIRVNMDSFNDRQSLYSFYVNPNGIQMDTRSDGRRDDPGIDFVWYSAGKIDEEGYTVEMQIPFKSIRYANKGDVVTMGMVFGRRISRLSVEGSYPELDPNLGDNFMIQTIPIEYKGIKKNTLLEVLPAFTRSKRYADNLGTLTPEKGISELGVTGKWGITSELVLDATYNPDFSQVEADVQQIDDNQRFALFYPERRPFFQEGSENFNIAGRAFTEGIQNVVNTRSVVNPIFATKLSGRLGAKNRIAAIYAKDEFLPDTEKPDSIDFADVYVLRYKRALNSDSYLGASFTNRYQEGKYNIVYGADGQYRLGKNSVLSSHFYKLSDNDTSNDVSMNEHALSINYRYSVRKFSVNTRYMDVSDNYFSEVGYQRRVGIRQYNLFLGPRFYPNTKLLKRIENWISLTKTLDKPSGMWEESYFLRVRSNWIRNTDFSLTFNKKSEIYDNSNDLVNPEEFDVDNWGVELESQVNKRIRLRGELTRNKMIRYVENPYSGYGPNLRAEMNWQISDKLNAELRYTNIKFYKDSDGLLDFHRTIFRPKFTFQLNKYFLFRTIFQYDSRIPSISTDFLASFTFIPGTVVHLGYGSLYKREQYDSTYWDVDNQVLGGYVDSQEYNEMNRGFFFKASYLFRK